jgi:hypothetical protein
MNASRRKSVGKMNRRLAAGCKVDRLLADCCVIDQPFDANLCTRLLAKIVENCIESNFAAAGD